MMYFTRPFSLGFNNKCGRVLRWTAP